MAHILTYSGIMIDPTNPEIEKIDIRDIAHSLSMVCRAGGHFKAFHSVAQHCISCAKEAEARGESKRVQLACLLHDGSEAYLSDITRPVKIRLPDYKKFEDVLQDIVWLKWLNTPLTAEERKTVFEIDDCMLYYEFKHFKDVELYETPPHLCTKPSYDFMPFKDVENEYMRIFNELI